LPKLEGVEVKKPLMEVTDEWSRRLDRLMLNEGRLSARQARARDYLTATPYEGPDARSSSTSRRGGADPGRGQERKA